MGGRGRGEAEMVGYGEHEGERRRKWRRETRRREEVRDAVRMLLSCNPTDYFWYRYHAVVGAEKTKCQIRIHHLCNKLLHDPD
eukprot:746210-Hanusia_phi.AAC.2